MSRVEGEVVSSTTVRDEIVITGVGVVSPLGIGWETFLDNVLQGKSGITRSTLYPGFAAPDQVGAEVRDFTDEAARKVYLKEHRKNLKAMCRDIQLGVASAMLALKDASIQEGVLPPERLGVEFGANLMFSAPDILNEPCKVCLDEQTHQFRFERWGEHGLSRMEPLWLLRYLPNMPACHISIGADARGPSNSLTLDDASGNMVIGEACRVLQRQAADAMITGSTGSTLHPIKTMHLALWHDLATSPDEPEKRCRPFDLHRSGRVVAEGACTLILERRTFAEQRGATIWGRILGTGSATVIDRYGHPNYRRALAQAMRLAIKSAGLVPEQIGHINAHGLGTKDLDREETLAIYDVFGEQGGTIPVIAPKSFLGNSGAGSGVLEIAASLVPLARQGVIPATLNYETPDPECRLNVVTTQLTPANRIFLNVNITRIGQASAAVIEAYPVGSG